MNNTNPTNRKAIFFMEMISSSSVHASMTREKEKKNDCSEKYDGDIL